MTRYGGWEAGGRGGGAGGQHGHMPHMLVDVGLRVDFAVMLSTSARLLMDSACASGKTIFRMLGAKISLKLDQRSRNRTILSTKDLYLYLRLKVRRMITLGDPRPHPSHSLSTFVLGFSRKGGFWRMFVLRASLGPQT